MIDEDLAEEEGEKKKRPKKAAAAAAATTQPAKKAKTSKADPMTGRGGEPSKSESLKMFTPVLPAGAKGKGKVVESDAEDVPEGKGWLEWASELIVNGSGAWAPI